MGVGKFKVYVMRCGRMYKIGQAIDPEARLKELSTGSAYPIRIWLVFECEQASRVERWLHRAAKPYRGNGGREWFELPLWFTGWLAKQTARALDQMAATDAPPPRETPRQEFVQCAHCGRSTQYRNKPYCYECQPLAESLDFVLMRGNT